jgi:hypothetical protein
MIEPAATRNTAATTAVARPAGTPVTGSVAGVANLRGA